METTTIRDKKMLPFLYGKKGSTLFLIINIYLVVGVGSLLATIVFLLLHLNKADEIVKHCVPGFILCISSGLFYYLGYHSLLEESHD